MSRTVRRHGRSHVASCITVGAGLALRVASTCAAQSAPRGEAGGYTVAGTVRGGATDAGLSGARVVLTPPTGKPDSDSGWTGPDGTFQFFRVSGGTVQLAIRRLGFRPETLAVEVPQVPGGGVVVLLEQVAQPLAPILVRAAAAPPRRVSAFEQRRATGAGHFITRADIEHARPTHTSDLLRSVAGITFTRGRNGALVPRFRATGRVDQCDPVFWVDGLPLGTGTYDLDALSPHAIEGIELYSSAATSPSALRATTVASGCGVIAIWTRRGGAAPDERPTEPGGGALEEMVARGAVFTADQVDLPAAPLPGLGPVPVYPDSLHAANVRGRVVAEFVVTRQGSVDAETIGIVSSTHPLFAAAVRAALAGAHFTPAYRHGEVVRQVVQLPVVFDLADVRRAERPPQ